MNNISRPFAVISFRAAESAHDPRGLIFGYFGPIIDSNWSQNESFNQGRAD